MGRLDDTPFTVISSGDDKAELVGMCEYYREHQRRDGCTYDLVDLQLEDAPIRSVYRYHLVRVNEGA